MQSAEILQLSLAAAVLGLDTTAAFQVALSRPLVAGTLGGLLLGDPAQGLALGAVLELIWLGKLPVGSLVPPDGTLAALFAAAAMGPLQDAGLPVSAAAALAMLGGIAVGWLSGWAEEGQRRLADRLDRWVESRMAAGHGGALTQGLAAGLALVAGRCAAVMLLALGLLLPALAMAARTASAELVEGLSTCSWLLLIFGLASAADHFWDRLGLWPALGASALAVAAAYVMRLPPGTVLAVLALYSAVFGALRWWSEGSRREGA